MRYSVYHAKNPKFILTQDNPNNFSEEFEKVAEVETNYGLDGVFKLTNHIDKPWWKNLEVKWHKPNTRSTSVGDVVIDSEGKSFLCDMTGWRQFNIDNP